MADPVLVDVAVFPGARSTRAQKLSEDAVTLDVPGGVALPGPLPGPGPKGQGWEPHTQRGRRWVGQEGAESAGPPAPRVRVRGRHRLCLWHFSNLPGGFGDLSQGPPRACPIGPFCSRATGTGQALLSEGPSPGGPEPTPRWSPQLDGLPHGKSGPLGTGGWQGLGGPGLVGTQPREGLPWEGDASVQLRTRQATGLRTPGRAVS